VLLAVNLTAAGLTGIVFSSDILGLISRTGRGGVGAGGRTGGGNLGYPGLTL